MEFLLSYSVSHCAPGCAAFTLSLNTVGYDVVIMQTQQRMGDIIVINA
jgi:hypothetical protein